MTDVVANIVFGIFVCLFYLFSVRKYNISCKDKIHIKTNWMIGMIIAISTYWFFVMGTSLFTYLDNVFWNLVIATVLAGAIVFTLRFQKPSQSFISRNILIFIILLTVLFMFNFAAIVDKLHFISKGDPIQIEELEKGDILFRHSGRGDMFIPGYWSHMGIFVGEINDSLRVIESTIRGVEMSTLKKFIGSNRVSVAKINSLTMEQRNEVSNWAIDKLGRSYHFNWFVKRVEADSYYCSELIWASYKHIDIDIDENPDFSIRYMYGVAPQELFGDDDLVVYHINRTTKEEFVG